MEIVKTQRMLMTLCLTLLAVAVALVVVFETALIEPGLGAATSANVEFMASTAMVLITLGGAFMALRLMKQERVAADLRERKAAALRQWGTLRLLMLEVPLVIDTLLYYIYMNTSFAYLALMLLLCLPFVWPGTDRCKAEISEEETEA